MPAMARSAFDVGNLSFANSWIAIGAFAILCGWESITARTLPRWLGWWAIVAGVGLVLARAMWTNPIWLFPYSLFWLWVLAVSVTLLVRALRRGTERPVARQTVS